MSEKIGDTPVRAIERSSVGRARSAEAAGKHRQAKGPGEVDHRGLVVVKVPWGASMKTTAERWPVILSKR
jgi:hypothetical protein